MKKLILVLLFGLFFASSASAQTALWTCDFNTTSCGFDLGATNGYLNVTSSTTMDWNATLYTWSNISTMVRCPTGGNGNKFQSISGSYKWLLDSTTWKNEPNYGINKGTMTLDAWVRMNFVHNHSANTSMVCIAGSCSSMGTWLVVKATETLTIESTYAGGKCAYDDMTIYVLDAEAPVSDTTPPSILFVRNHSITNASAIIETNASEASNLSVKYGTTLNLGSTSVNTTVATNVSAGLTGLSKLTLYYYNVTRCDAAGNCNTSGPRNFTTLDNPIVNTTIWVVNITGISDYGNHSIELVWANSTTGETATNTTTLTFRVDSPPDTVPPSFNVTNDSISNITFRVFSNASEAANMSVKYGTTVNLGTAAVNVTVSANLSINVTGLTANTLYYYNVTRCDASSNCNTTGPWNVTTSTNPAAPSANATTCSGILTLVWNANISRGSYDPKTKTYNESGILPVNNSVCGWTYMLNNSLVSTAVFNFSTNHTDASGNYTMFVNGSMINASSTKLISVPAGAVYYVNVSVNLTRWPVLRSEPSINFTVRT